MVDAELVGLTAATETVSPAVLEVLRHLCVDEHRAFGGVLEWCETRGDCVQAVVCPACARQFVVDEDDLRELLRWTDGQGRPLACGVRWD
ncbi:MAG: hypothetical protein IT337_12075 [Thermomicrobiales bacterium]|nr:hypothetical protein [Thermomicrobiales bacterium]